MRGKVRVGRSEAGTQRVENRRQLTGRSGINHKDTPEEGQAG